MDETHSFDSAQRPDRRQKPTSAPVKVPSGWLSAAAVKRSTVSTTNATAAQDGREERTVSVDYKQYQMYSYAGRCSHKD